MKCPQCGADLKGKTVCSKCGRKIELPPQIEVEYKDFKLSEYLEIRRKEQKGKSGDVTACIQEGEEQKGQDTYDRAATMPEKKPAAKPAAAPPGDRDRRGEMPESPSQERKRSFSAVAVILLLLALLAGALYLWRLLKP